MANTVTLAVAGSRKTQGIIDYCCSLTQGTKAVLLTFTQTNQAELKSRLRKYASNNNDISVLGWYTFLLREFARPFLPFKFPGERVLGFNFDGRPHRMASGINRFLDSNGFAYACELSRLSHELIEQSGGALIRRLSCLYHEILIDEVQDFSSHDWEILDALLNSPIKLTMVGDIRQAVLSTNSRSSKNKKYAYAESIHWFRERERRGILSIIENNKTWRCHPEVAAFSDTIFDVTWGFPRTESLNERVTGHDGVFLVRPELVDLYIKTFNPQCLRDSANSGKKLELDYLNFRLAKGMTFERVLIVLTAGIEEFIKKGKYLEPLAASKFYVAVTRASQSVALVLEKPGMSQLPYWNPINSHESELDNTPPKTKEDARYNT